MSYTAEELLKWLGEKKQTEITMRNHCSNKYAITPEEIYHKENAERLDAIAAIIRDYAERQNPKPLTLDELRQMDGKPVWAISGDNDMYGWFIVSSSKHEIELETGPETIWTLELDNAESEFTPDQDFYGMMFEDDAKYGAKFGLHLMGWLAYDYPPPEKEADRDQSWHGRSGSHCTVRGDVVLLFPSARAGADGLDRSFAARRHRGATGTRNDGEHWDRYRRD
jgi:hypothetical protein